MLWMSLCCQAPPPTIDADDRAFGGFQPVIDDVGDVVRRRDASGRRVVDDDGLAFMQALQCIDTGLFAAVEEEIVSRRRRNARHALLGLKAWYTSKRTILLFRH